MTQGATDKGAGPGLRERHKARNRAAIIDAALESFAELGYFGTSAGDIAERADLSVGTFFNYFEDKQEVFAALVQDTFQTLLEKIVAMDVENLPLDQRLEALLTATFQHVHDNAELHVVIHRNMSLLREVFDLDQYRAVLEEVLRDGGEEPEIDLELMFESVMGAHMEVGQAMLFRENGDPREAARFVSGLVYGGVQRMRTRNTPLDVGAEIAQAAREHSLAEKSDDDDAVAHDGTRERRKAENRAAILKAARDAFAESGFAETGIRDISRRAGLAPGTIYNYFTDKESILRSLADRYFGEFADDNYYCRRHATSLEELVAGQVRSAYNIAWREPVMFEMVDRNMSEVWRMMPSIQNLTRTATEFAIDTRGLIEQGFLPPIDPDYLVVSILGVGFAAGRVVALRGLETCDWGVKFVTDFFTGGILQIAGLDPTARLEPFERTYARPGE